MKAKVQAGLNDTLYENIYTEVQKKINSWWAILSNYWLRPDTD